jgi:hypothetical protein
MTVEVWLPGAYELAMGSVRRSLSQAHESSVTICVGTRSQREPTRDVRPRVPRVAGARNGSLPRPGAVVLVRRSLTISRMSTLVLSPDIHRGLLKECDHGGDPAVYLSFLGEPELGEDGIDVLFDGRF